MYNEGHAMAGTATVNIYGGEITGWVDITDIDNYNNCGVAVSGEYDANAQ